MFEGVSMMGLCGRRGNGGSADPNGQEDGRRREGVAGGKYLELLIIDSCCLGKTFVNVLNVHPARLLYVKMQIKTRFITYIELTLSLAPFAPALAILTTNRNDYGGCVIACLHSATM